MPQPAEIVFCVNLCRHALFKILKVKLYLVLNVSKYKSTSKSFEIYAFLFFIMYTEQKTGRLLSTLNKYRFESLVVFVWNISRLTTCIMLKIVINGSFWFYLTMYNHIYIIKKKQFSVKIHMYMLYLQLDVQQPCIYIDTNQWWISTELSSRHLTSI